ncbi:MAG TPA: hypothetical protein PKU95_04545 [Candidatus Dojkabacteria bacterium]|nr:hypothetical protein [Candidatus Dojkabacteria bacterium]
MRRYCLIIICSILLLAGNTQVVKAVKIEQCSINSSVEINEASTRIKQELMITNESPQLVIEKLHFDFPYQISDVVTNVDGKNVLNNSNGSALEVNLFYNFIPPKGQKSLSIEYSVTDLLNLQGGFHNFYLPRFDYCNSQQNSYTIKLPVKVADISYISAESFETLDEQTIKMELDSDVYISWGQLLPLGINIEWRLDHGYFIPMPSSKFSRLTLTQIPAGVKFFKDQVGNELFNMSNGMNYLGGYQGKLYPIDKEISYEGPMGFIDDASKWDIPSESGIREIYNAVLDKYDPLIKRNSSSLLPLSQIESMEGQDALQYAYSFAYLAESRGYQANIYYGLLELPISNELLWHFWAGVKSADSETMEFYDPFLEDLLGYASFGKVSPQRYAWGTYNQSVREVPEAMHNVTNSTTMIEYLETQQEAEVMGASFLVEAFLNKPQDLSRKTELVIKNAGSDIVFLSKILLNDGVDITGDYADQGILPGTARVIVLNKEIPTQLLLEDQGKLKAEVIVNGLGREYIIDTNEVNITAQYIYVALLISLYLFMAGSIILIQRNYSKLKILLPSPKGR